MKICPYCAEEIQSEAIKCRYCKSTLNLDEQKQTTKKEAFTPQPPLDFIGKEAFTPPPPFDFIGKEAFTPQPPLDFIGKEALTPQPPLDFIGAVGTCFRKYFDFTGRATRSEYWYFCLFTGISIFVAQLLDLVWFDTPISNWWEFEAEVGPWETILFWGTLIPGLAVHARRLHDTNKSGWRILWNFTVVGVFFVLYWLTVKSDANKNSYELNQ